MEAFKDEIPCFEDMYVVPFSSITFEGVDKLREIVEEVISDDEEIN